MLNLTEAQLVNKQVEKCYLQFLEIVLPLLSSLGFTMYFAHLALARFFFFVYSAVCTNGPAYWPSSQTNIAVGFCFSFCCWLSYLLSHCFRWTGRSVTYWPGDLCAMYLYAVGKLHFCVLIDWFLLVPVALIACAEESMACTEDLVDHSTIWGHLQQNLSFDWFGH